MELRSEIFNIIKAGYVGDLYDGFIGIDKQFGRFAQPQVADENIHREPGNCFYLFIQTGMAHADFLTKRRNGKIRFLQVVLILATYGRTVSLSGLFFSIS